MNRATALVTNELLDDFIAVYGDMDLFNIIDTDPQSEGRWLMTFESKYLPDELNGEEVNFHIHKEIIDKGNGFALKFSISFEKGLN